MTSIQYQKVEVLPSPQQNSHMVVSQKTPLEAQLANAVLTKTTTPVEAHQENGNVGIHQITNTVLDVIEMVMSQNGVLLIGTKVVTGLVQTQLKFHVLSAVDITIYIMNVWPRNILMDQS